MSKNLSSEEMGLRKTCSICRKEFKHQNTLKRHIKVVHQGYRPFACECGKNFATNEQYTRHLNSKHTFQKPYKCERGCENSFASYTARDYHHKFIHDRQRFVCPILGCGKGYTSKRQLQNHMNKPHTSNYYLAMQLMHWYFFCFVSGYGFANCQNP